MGKTQRKITADQRKTLLRTMQDRFDAHPQRHPHVTWDQVESLLAEHPEKLWSLMEMERTEGEPDLVNLAAHPNQWVFVDCSPESPGGRRSLCYDREALDARKEAKPRHSAVAMAAEMGVELLTEAMYRDLQRVGEFDRKTSSWVQTPTDIRDLGGALFCDRRYGQVFVYHNGASSYYAARGFRAMLTVGPISFQP